MMTIDPAARESGAIEQTHCPVMGGPIDKDVFILYQGKSLLCCPGCEASF